MTTTTEQWKAALNNAANPEKARILSGFFKTGKGEYGEGDIFIGIPVPVNRRISSGFLNATDAEVTEMLTQPIHEYRLSALLVTVARYRKSATYEEKARQIAFYLSNTRYINNWDLVDLSAPYILGAEMLATGNDTEARRLVSSTVLWEQRIAVVSTITLIRAQQFDTAFFCIENLLNHPHSLIQKANGWMLREIGKKSPDTLRRFLDQYAATMPRTTLRYAIERMDNAERHHYMAIKPTTNPQNATQPE